MEPWKLSPSDFAFLWDECKRCFYLKVVHNFNRPRTPMPTIFITIDGLMKQHFQSMLTSEIHPGLPPGRVAFGDRFVESAQIVIPGVRSTCLIRGRTDTILGFDDGTYGVVDFKTSATKEANVARYGRQLHAYAYALEHPAPKRLHLAPVSRLGLLCVELDEMVAISAAYAYKGPAQWIECPKDDRQFLGFIAEVLSVLDQPEAPPATVGCVWCAYRDQARVNGL